MNKWAPSAIIFILTNIYCIQSCEGVLESVKETLDGLKSYAGEILPYIQKGVKMVQQADKFVDNAIGEDCTYECAKEGLVCLDNIFIISWGLSPSVKKLLIIRTLFYCHYS